MKKNKKKKAPMPLTTTLLFGLAAVLLLLGTAGSSRAALTYFSENYSAQIEMYDIGVTLVENGNDISHRDYTQRDDVWDENTGRLLTGMVPEGEMLQPGKPYNEVLTVRNSGTIDEYVRVMVYRYWVDKDGKKLTEMSPELIDLDMDTVGPANGWIIDKKASTTERTVLYYPEILKSGAVARPLSETLRINGLTDGKVIREEKKVGDKTIITMKYEYDGAQFVLEAETDAVQTHNAEEAIQSAWGVDVSIDESDEHGRIVSLK